jgi:pyruvate-formate lyase-activating enzyme
MVLTPLTALVANRQGEIFELDGYGAVGAAGADRAPLTVEETVPLPHGAELMYLPDRYPIVFDPDTGAPATLTEDPYEPGEPIFPVAAFNSPGYLLTRNAAWVEADGAAGLPLFAYGAVGWGRNGFRTAAIRVDREPRQDLREMPRSGVVAGIATMQKAMPDNRLRAHLETCALTYGCPAAKNFFLGRYEAPLPTATRCNANCLGCLSLQAEGGLPCSQDRIDFTPTPAEIAEVALTHIRRVPRAVVSFGQGCEGDPLMAAWVIAEAISRIRRETDAGTINVNTNASLPDRLKTLFDAGLDSVRVSLNSVREAPYTAYFRPNYAFADVLAAIDHALERDRWVSINYLSLPGFVDSSEESAALLAFLRDHPVKMIQWRNLNFDPVRYHAAMASAGPVGRPIGVRRLLDRVRREAPAVRHGYFNPPILGF